MTTSTSPRLAAYKAVLASLQEKAYAAQSLEEWSSKEHPSSMDERFAREIAYGAIRMARSLDFMAEKASQKNKLKLGNREKALLRTASYQIAFMDRTAAYAVVNESVKIAKSLGNPTFPGFLNAILRRLSEALPQLPEDLGIRFSYPDYFVNQILQTYPVEKAIEILEAGNHPSQTYARKRPSFEMIKIQGNEISEIASLQDYYIQNPTPEALMESLCSSIPIPKTILDLCSAPGGKLVASHDLFPEAKLFANEASKDRAVRLYDNIAKYGLNTEVTIGLGEDYPTSTDRRFDLIIIDAPCSNSGVLNKRPEARWRINAEALENLNKTQHALIQQSSKLLNPNGTILYLTCSVLPIENEGLIKDACIQYSLLCEKQNLFLPDLQGQDGGFASLLKPV